MKIQVEIDDLWIEEGQIESELKNHVISTVTNNIYTSIKQNVQNEITNQVKQSIENSLSTIISLNINNLVNQNIFKNSYSTQDVNLELFVKKIVEDSSNNYGKQYLDKIVRERVDKIAIELKNRYDIVFASQIVTKLHEQGFLKEDIAKLLLNS